MINVFLVPITEAGKNKIAVGAAGLLLALVFPIIGVIFYKRKATCETHKQKKPQTTKSETVSWVIALVNVSSVLIIPHFTLAVIIPTSNSVTVTVAVAVFTLTF